MPVGFLRRLARQSAQTTQIPLINTFPVLTNNWTTQETDTYNAILPADGPAAYGGTIANLDRILTATGSGYTVFGLLLTFVNKPEANILGQHGSLGGAIVKITPTFAVGSLAAIELWSLDGATWTKRRRISLAGYCRSGETVVVDLTLPELDTDLVDAYWITLAPDLGTETMTWLACHVYGICPNDPLTDDCPPATPPDECGEPECSIDIATGRCTEDTGTPDPFVFPPLLVKIANPTSYVQSVASFFHNCPRPTMLRMMFGDLPSGGSVTVTVANAHGLTFAEGVSQVISAAGNMDWTVVTGFVAANPGSDPAFPPAALTPTTDFFFTRQLAGIEALVALGNLLDILTYFWTYDFGYVELC